MLSIWRVHDWGAHRNCVMTEYDRKILFNLMSTYILSNDLILHWLPWLCLCFLIFFKWFSRCLQGYIWLIFLTHASDLFCDWNWLIFLVFRFIFIVNWLFIWVTFLNPILFAVFLFLSLYKEVDYFIDLKFLSRLFRTRDRDYKVCSKSDIKQTKAVKS